MTLYILLTLEQTFIKEIEKVNIVFSSINFSAEAGIFTDICSISLLVSFIISSLFEISSSSLLEVKTISDLLFL